MLPPRRSRGRFSARADLSDVPPRGSRAARRPRLGGPCRRRGRAGRPRPFAVGMVNAAVRRHAAVDRPVPAARPALLAPPLPEGVGGVGARFPRPLPRRLPRAGARRGAPRRPGRLRPVPDPARRAVHDRRRHPRPRHPARFAAGQRRDPRDRHRDRLAGRHDRRRDAADPPAAARQPGAAAPRSHRGLLHLPGRQHRRLADAARRPSVVSRFPPRRAVLLDPAAVAGDAAGRGAPARSLPRARHLLLAP
ncbi:MAG: hypothetical protein H6Q02_1397 [Acidobacteria bacterium]|nr:hypothetical protein [Acidobacteriota bacterium]